MSVRTYEQISDLPAGITPVTGAELVELEQDGVSRKFTMTELGGITAEHQGTHQFGSTDPIGTHEKVENAIPYLNASGLIDDHVSDASTTAKGKVQLASDGESAASKAVQADDGRLSNSRAPTAHASSHYGVGDDLIPSATTETSGLMSNGDKTKLDSVTVANIPTAGEKTALPFLEAYSGALIGTYGTPGSDNRFVTEDDPAMTAALLQGKTFYGVSLAGTKLNIPVGPNPYVGITSLNTNDIAFYDRSNNKLETYRRTGSVWAKVGNSLTIAVYNDFTLVAISSTDIAFVDRDRGTIRTYHWDGTDWAQVGNALEISYLWGDVIKLTSTDVVIAENNAKTLTTYHWDGTDWAQVGNALSLGVISKISSLTSSDIALIDCDNEYIYAYHWDGTDWAQYTGGLAISCDAYIGVSTLSTSTIAYIGSATISPGEGRYRLYYWNGSAWSQTGYDQIIKDSFNIAISALSSTEIALYNEYDEMLVTYEYVYGYDSCSINVDADFTVTEIETGKSMLLRKPSAYNGNALVITPPSGATFEGKSSISLYGQYSFVILERISATVFAVRDLQDSFNYTPVLSFGGNSVGITYTVQSGRCTRGKDGGHYHIEIVTTSKGSSTGANAVSLPLAITGSSVGCINSAGISYTGTLTTLAGSSTVRAYQITEAGSRTSIADTGFANGMALIIDLDFKEA